MSTPISGLPEAQSVNAADIVPIVQDGVTLKASAELFVNSQLPTASVSNAGIIQIGTAPNTACDGSDFRLSNSRIPTGSAGGDLTGTYPNPTLVPLCTAGTYGSTSAIPVLTLDSNGRVTSIQTSEIIVNANNITSGILDVNRLATSGVAAGSVGSSTQIPVLNIDSKGRVTSIETSQLVVNANNITSGTLDANRLATSGVSVGTFGSSTQIPVLTVDDKGRVTSIQNVTPLPGNNASDLTVGTLDPNRLATSGVSAGTFGTSSSVAQFTVDSKGRITSATNVGISGSAGGTVVAVGATSGTLAISGSPVTYSGAFQLELSTTGVSAITAGSSTQSAVITVDAYGRITNLATQSIAALSPTGVSAGTYGSDKSVGKFTVNANGVVTGATEQTISLAASQVLSGLTSAQITGISAAQVGVGISSAQITGISAAQVGSGLTSAQIGVLSSSQISGISAAQVAAGITSAQVNGLAASQISGSITSAQINGLSAAQVGAGITSAQLSAITGTGAVVLASSPTIATPVINGYTEGVVNAGSPVGASATLSITAGTVLTATLTSATQCTFTMPAVGAGKSFTLYLKQPATGTPTTATFTGVAWPAAGTPVITATLGRMDILSFVSDGVKWYGNFVQNFTY